MGPWPEYEINDINNIAQKWIGEFTATSFHKWNVMTVGTLYLSSLVGGWVHLCIKQGLGKTAHAPNPPFSLFCNTCSYGMFSYLLKGHNKQTNSNNKKRIGTDNIWPIRPKIFTTWPFKENICPTINVKDSSHAIG